MMLDDGGVKYKIERFRKHSTHKNQLYAWQLDPAGGKSTPLHKGTDRETQPIVTKIMGCSLEVFAGSIYAGQEKMPDLPGMTDKFLKLLVEEAAGVEELAEAYAVAQKQAVTADRALTAAKTTHNNCSSLVASSNASLTEAEEQVTYFEAARKDQARLELAKAIPLNASLTALNAALTAIDHAALTARKGVLDAEFAANGSQRIAMDNLNRLANATDSEVTLCKNELRRAMQAAAEAKTALENVSHVIGTPCGTCGKEYCEEDLADVKLIRAKDLAAADKLVVERTAKARTAIAAAAAATADAIVYKTGMTDVTTASAELATVGTMLNEHTRLEGQIVNLNTQIANIKRAAAGKLTESNPWLAPLANRKTLTAQAVTDEAAALVTVDTLAAKAELINDAVKVFGPAGVRAHILDTVTPFLNDRTGEYLGGAVGRKHTRRLEHARQNCKG
ncbi:hypothetical protein LP414_27275 [Polaromonas sp. P1(28)-13]|nr:hypothetical protein LP414_27275 [Polaromonas sp. P1(28)-13]